MEKDYTHKKSTKILLLTHSQAKYILKHRLKVAVSTLVVDGDYGGGHAGGSVVKNPPEKKRDWDPSLSQEDPQEKGIATCSSILAWEIP